MSPPTMISVGLRYRQWISLASLAVRVAAVAVAASAVAAVWATPPGRCTAVPTGGAAVAVAVDAASPSIAAGEVVGATLTGRAVRGIHAALRWTAAANATADVTAEDFANAAEGGGGGTESAATAAGMAGLWRACVALGAECGGMRGWAVVEVDGAVVGAAAALVGSGRVGMWLGIWRETIGMVTRRGDCGIVEGKITSVAAVAIRDASAHVVAIAEEAVWFCRMEGNGTTRAAIVGRVPAGTTIQGAVLVAQKAEVHVLLKGSRLGGVPGGDSGLLRALGLMRIFIWSNVGSVIVGLPQVTTASLSVDGGCDDINVTIRTPHLQFSATESLLVVQSCAGTARFFCEWIGGWSVIGIAVTPLSDGSVSVMAHGYVDWLSIASGRPPSVLLPSAPYGVSAYSIGLSNSALTPYVGKGLTARLLLI